MQRFIILILASFFFTHSMRSIVVVFTEYFFSRFSPLLPSFFFCPNFNSHDTLYLEMTKQLRDLLCSMVIVDLKARPSALDVTGIEPVPGLREERGGLIQ